ncbi:hypothetical protein DBR17_07980 [Sphingomonas sp. HMWF008]|nr:hypothetical protein DBR17_07980 [Sphingomonas sp. HMWF008]
MGDTIMALSVVAIKAAENRDKAYKLSDRDGLYLLVTPTGGRYWRMNYRYLGKQKTLAFAFGPKPASLMRGPNATRRAKCSRGEDPAERMKLDRIAATVAASNSLKAVADKWPLKIEKESCSAVTMKRLRWFLGFINASIGRCPVASISAHELLVMARKPSVVARGFAITSLVVLASACGNGDAGTPPAPRSSTVGAALAGPPAAIPLRIANDAKPLPTPAQYQAAQPIAAAAQSDLSLIAQARYCWPSVRPDATESPYAGMILANARAAMPPACVPEPAAIRRFAERAAGRRADTAPLTPFQAFVGATSYGKVAAEGCAGKLRDAPTSGLRRRWFSDVRLKRTGDATIDGAFATILADPGFGSAMGRIKVSLVNASANVIIVHSLGEAGQPNGQAACGSTDPATTCQRDSEAEAREGLARALSNGRTGYFPYANDFATDYPIGVEVPGFTIGDRAAITGAVCLNFGRVSRGSPARQPGSPEQAAARHRRHPIVSGVCRCFRDGVPAARAAACRVRCGPCFRVAPGLRRSEIDLRQWEEVG